MIHEIGDVLALTTREVYGAFARVPGVEPDLEQVEARMQAQAAESFGRAVEGWVFRPEHFRVEVPTTAGMVKAVARWDPSLTRAGVVCGGPIDGWEFVGPEPRAAAGATGSGPQAVMLRVAPVLVARVEGCRVVAVRQRVGGEKVGVGEVELVASGWSDAGRWTYAAYV